MKLRVVKSGKLYAVRECQNCGNDDRYCDACVGAAIEKAKPKVEIQGVPLKNYLMMGAAFVFDSLALIVYSHLYIRTTLVFLGSFIALVNASNVFKFPFKFPVRQKIKRCVGAEWQGTKYPKHREFRSDERTCKDVAVISCEKGYCNWHCENVCWNGCPAKIARAQLKQK